MSIEASASLRSSSEPAVVDRAGDADAACGEQRCAHNSVEEAAESREIRAKPLRRRGAPYSLTIGDHFALMITSALLMMSVYFYYYVDLYGTGDWNYHMTQRPPTPQAADEELFLVAMQHQIAEHKKKGLMPEDPRGNFTITSITNELDSFKFRVLQDIRRKAEAPGPTEQKIAKAHRMAMEAAESAYLEQLAADAKADAAYGYVEPWSMPKSLDQFAGEEGEDDGGLYGEWRDRRDESTDAEEEESTAGGKHGNTAGGSAVHDDVIHAEPVGGYEKWQDGVDDDDFYGYGGDKPPAPTASGHGSLGAGSRDKPIDKGGRVDMETLAHVPSEYMGKPAIALSMEGTPHAPALVFETRGFDPASGNVEIRVGGEKVMQTQQPDGEISINTEGRDTWTIDASARIFDGKGKTVATTRKVFTQADVQ